MTSLFVEAESAEHQRRDLAAPQGTCLGLPYWAPDGTSFFCFNFDKQQIVQVDIASGQVVRTFSETSQGFGVSPDGRFLVAGSKSGEPNALHLIPMSGGEKRELIRFSPPATSVLNWGTIAWSPDSQGVAFFGTVRGDKGMWLAPIDGSQPRKIASGIESMGVWRFNATSGQVVFSSDAAPRVEVWKIENFLPVQTAKR